MSSQYSDDGYSNYSRDLYSLPSYSSSSSESSPSESQASLYSSFSFESFYEDTLGVELKAFLFWRLGSRFPSFPDSVLHRISSDILRLSETEPYGLRGASLHIRRRDAFGREIREKPLRIDESTVSTFRIYFELREKESRLGGMGRRIRDLLRLPPPALPSKDSGIEVSFDLSDDYDVFKHQLYRS